MLANVSFVKLRLNFSVVKMFAVETTLEVIYL